MRNCVNSLELTSWSLSFRKARLFANYSKRFMRKRPALRAHDKSILVGAGLEFVDRNYKLNPGEEIAIMPPVQGG